MANDPERRERSKKLGAWFLGPKAENADLEEKLFSFILQDYFHWRRNYYPADEIVVPQSMRREFVDWNDDLTQKIAEMLAGLRKHFPFYSPRYMGHMLSDQTIPAVLGYFAGLLYNPNNVSPEGAPVTVRWELEVGRDVLEMLGYKSPPSPGGPHEARSEFGWAHITSGGTIANIESLWAARNACYFPLAAHHVVREMNIDLPVTLANQSAVNLRELEESECLGLAPSDVLHLLPRLTQAIALRLGVDEAAARGKTLELLASSGHSVAHSGAAACFSKYPPAIFVSAAKHYSITKAANLLGIGSGNVIPVDVDGLFRMDVRDLQRKMSEALKRGMFPLAVIAIAGTTEEGAVDPIHEIADLRQRRESETCLSFWLHVDAAWGGYLRSLFIPGPEEAEPEPASLGEHIVRINEYVSRDLDLSDRAYSRAIHLQWGGVNACSAFLAFPKADSISVDPHKMGYIPYPCGVVAFKSDRIRQFLAEDAPYLESAVDAPEAHLAPTSVGPYIVEGSKPGCAVAACWLSHRMIPLNRDGYGEIARASILAARELYERIVHWGHAMKANRVEAGFELFPLTSQPPDTNVVCFLAKERASTSLARMNSLNRRIYEQFTIESEYGEGKYSYSQPFFLSHTVIRYPNYAPHVVQGPLERFNIDPSEYREHGLFVLRATMMSPYVTLAAETGNRRPYLAQFMERLSAKAEEGIARGLD